MNESPMEAAGAAPNLPEYSVAELSFALKRVVEDSFGYVRVRGEISGFKRAASGHLYLSLKDDKAVIDGVCWRGTANGLRFKPEDGLEVVCTGRLTTYPARSRYQIVIERMEPAGVGALMALLEERRKKLAAEGLFDEDRKRPLPFLPGVVGVVTSPTGAVIRDILHRLRDRFPSHVVVWPVLVQGEGAAGQIAAAIQGFNKLPADGPVARPALLIVARGGGSIEDLWAFNEEAVVRAAAASEIPLISAVGHETDTTLIDFASDRRAPTPTAAAEIAVPVRAELMAQVRDLERRAGAATQRLVVERRRHLDGLVRGLPRAGDLLAMAAQRLDDAAGRLGLGLRGIVTQRAADLRALAAQLRPALLAQDVARQRDGITGLIERLQRAGGRQIQDAERRLAASAQLLESLSYRNVLARGYAVVREAGGGPVTAAAATRPGMALDIEFHDASASATVDGEAAPARRATRRKKTPDGQGTLL